MSSFDRENIITYCKYCGAIIFVDRSKRLSVCPKCNEPFVVEEAHTDFYYNCRHADLSDSNLYCAITPKYIINDGVLTKCVGDGNCIIPYGTKEIGFRAFEDCNALSIYLPDTVTTIGDEAFNGWYGQFYGNLRLPKTLISIGKKAFENNSFHSFDFPPFLKTIDDQAFKDCYNLTSIDLPYGLNKLGDAAFLQCYKLKHVYIPGTVKTIYYTFASCHELSEVVLDEGIEYIGSYTFNHCKSLESITIPYSVKRIGRQAFRWCESIRKVTIKNPSLIIDECDQFFGWDRVEEIDAPSQWIQNNRNLFRKTRPKFPWFR